MKRVMTMLGIVGFCSVAAIASAQTTPATSKPMKATKAEKAEKAAPTTVTGCVAAGADAKHFTLTGDDKTSYTLVGGTLKPHVGHKVEVTGTAGKGAATTLHVKSVKMVAPTCS